MQIQSNFSLKPYNTFGIDTRTRYFSAFSDIEQLKELTTHAAAGTGPQLKTFILGGGSNILFTKDFDGLVLKNDVRGITKINEDDEYVCVKVGAGENWHQFVLYCIQNGWQGIENLSLIPGNVGASPMQNIGAYGVEIKEVFLGLNAFHRHERIVQKFDIGDCEFGYRESVFKQKYRNQFVILNVTYRLRKQARLNTSYGAIEQELERMEVKELSIRAIADAVINIRRSKLPDPAVIGNAGSFFKNPEVSLDEYSRLQHEFPGIVGYPAAGRDKIKLAAGWMIENTGWKGYREGEVGVHDKQALVLVNYGNADGKDIYELSTKVVDSIRGRYGVELEREVNII